MAMLEKRGRSFRIIFRHCGVRYARALSTKDEQAAQATLARLEDHLHRLELGTLEVPPDADLVSFLLSDGRTKRKLTKAAEPTNGPLTLTGLFSSYWEKLPNGSLEDSTITGMEIHQRQLEKHFGKTFTISSLSLGDLQGYVEKRSKDEGVRGRKVTPVTIKKAIVTLRTVWNWGKQHGLVEKAFPSKGLIFPKGTEKPPFMTFAEVSKRVSKLKPAEAADLWECVFLSLPELDELLRHVAEAAEPVIYSMFLFAAHTGARRSEMIRSKLVDLDFDGNLITIHERKKSHDKRTTRRVPMSPSLRQNLEELVRVHPNIEHTFWHELPSLRGHKRVHPEQLKPGSADYSFNKPLFGTKWDKLRGWHVFRHSFCSNCASKGIDQRIIDGWVGHLSPDMVRRYRHLLPDQQQAAIGQVFGATPQFSA